MMERREALALLAGVAAVGRVRWPLEGPRVSGDVEALRLAVSLDPMPLARGLHDLTDATLAEILAV